MNEAEKAAARMFRAAQRRALAVMEAPDIMVSVFVRQYRHECASQGGRSVALELREHYATSPEYLICCSSEVAVPGQDFPHRDCDVAVPAGKFGFIWTEGRCAACKMTARSGTGRLVDAAARPPAAHSIVTP